MDTVTVENAWSFNGDEYVCVTDAIGEERITLDAIGEGGASRALVKTLAGTAATEATAESVREVLVTTGDMVEVTADELPRQCDTDTIETE